MKTLGAYMIVKNEESCIATCLNSIINICDEIVIVDTGCSDKTMEIVASFNSSKIKTSTFKWINDFSAARNYAKSLTTADYVFTTDADEQFTPELQNKMLEMKQNDFYDYTAIELWLLNKNIDAKDTTFIGGRTVVKNNSIPVWKYKIHEKLYFDETNICTLSFDDGYILHNHKNANSTDGYDKYAEIYLNELNGNTQDFDDFYAHYFYYLFFTIKNIDEVTAKSWLAPIFLKKNIKAISEEQRVNLLVDGYLSKEQFYILSMQEKLDAGLLETFFNNFETDEVAKYIAFKIAYDNIEQYTTKEKDFILPIAGLSFYNNGDLIKFIDTAKKHIEISPFSETAIYNNDFIEDYILPFHTKYKLVIDCSDTTHLASIIYFTSKYFYNVYLVNGDELKIRKNFNLSTFSNVHFIKNIKEVEGTLLKINASSTINKTSLVTFFTNLIYNNIEDAKYDIFSIIENPYKIKVALCVLCRKENKYIREYINHYKNIGFDKIFIYENNRDYDDERLITEIEDYVNDGFVNITEWKYETDFQNKAYDDCYRKNSPDYDWIAFYDADEYLIIKDNLNIKDFVRQDIFKGKYQISTSVVHYSNSGIITNNKKRRLNVFNELSFNNKYFYKSMIRTKLDITYISDKKFYCPHHIVYTENRRTVNADGENIVPSFNIFLYKAFKNAYIKHIPTSSLNDFIETKKVRKQKSIDKNYDVFGLDYYIKYNKITPNEFDYWFKNKDNEIKVALCMIGRLENKYIEEYVKYYLGLEFDKIFIYDNNRPNEENFLDELHKYVDNGSVEIISWPIFEGNAQKPAYQDCFNKHHKEFDWIAFFDADEYFTPCNCNNIKDFLNNKLYDNYGGVAIPFKNFDDNDLIVNDSNTRLDKYTREIKNDTRHFLKTIVRCNVNSVDFLSPISDGCHLPYMKDNRICDADGNPTIWRNVAYLSNECKNAYLKHIPTGCIDDFITGKDRRGWPDTNNDMSFGLQYFSYYNKLTQEKIDYYNNKKASD